MSSDPSSNLLSAVEAIYQTALSPDEYEAFIQHWDRYVASLDPDSLEADQLLSHIDRATVILDQLHPASRASFSPAALVEAETGPAAIADDHGDFLACNESWKRAMGEEAHRLGDLSGEPEERQALTSAMHMLHEVGRAQSGFARITDRRSGSSMGVVIRRLGRAESGLHRQHYLVRTSHAVWSDAVGEVLASEFNLTGAELALLERIVLGESFSKIAEEAGRSTDTLKTQSKAIYRKMCIGGREDAVRLALQLHHLMQGVAPRGIRRGGGLDQGLITLKSGRQVGWTRRGNPATQPLIFLHGMSLGHGMTEPFIQALDRRGLHMICIDRPGYGRSDPPRNWRHTVEEWGQTFPQILDGLGLEKAMVVTHTSGVLYGCAAGMSAPDRVTSVCALAGGVPIHDPDMLSDYPSMVRLLSRTARLSPRALRFMLGTSAAYYRSDSGRNRLLERTYSASTVDSAALKNPEILELVHEGFGLIDGGGFDGFVGDGLKIFSDWSGQVEGLARPLHYVIGDQDPICPLKWARAFAQRYTHVDVTPIEQAGQLLHHTHPEAVADLIAGIHRSTA